jgi:hypothetical protein
MNYICSNCGSPKTTVRKARPSIDDRYALGYCAACSGSGENRIERNLCRSDVWRPELLAERKRVKAEQKLLRHVVGPQESHKYRGEMVGPPPVTDEERTKAREILARQEALWQRT